MLTLLTLRRSTPIFLLRKLRILDGGQVSFLPRYDLLLLGTLVVVDVVVIQPP